MEDKEYNNLNYGGGFTEEDIKRVSLFEQAANNWIKSTSEFLSVKNGFKAGAKWQAERMYSEEDLKHLEWIYGRLVDVHNENPNYDYILKFKSIIEKFKKK
jgi:hypothetical protein